jgi:hypothetical protein
MSVLKGVAANYLNPSLPLLYLIISIVGLLDMTCSVLELFKPQETIHHTSLHHNLRRRAVDILLKAYLSSAQSQVVD